MPDPCAILSNRREGTMRFGWRGVVFCLAMVGSGPALAQARAPIQPGQYGGGFIEYLMTGSAQGQPSTATVRSPRVPPSPEP
jgi:hypothetical protein